ncbi:MAG: 1,4-alpha-glucan branching protein GlgB [Verrucomicrobiales bacterium]
MTAAIPVSELDRYYIAEGTHHHLYHVLGAHPHVLDGVSGYRFAVWAPNARRVSVAGDWNQFDGRVDVLHKDLGTGIWTGFVPGIADGQHYKFELEDAHGALRLKSDPFAFFSQHTEPHAALTCPESRHVWNDHVWLAERATGNTKAKPMSIYEVHLGSWARRHEQGGRPLSYLELADDLVDYAVHHGFTHLELMPVSEHPFSGSWGYQCTGYFAPTSRFGTPDEFRAFIDKAHQRGLGVILDWVPAHFPKDDHALAFFDGTALYEHVDPRQGEHPDWGTLVFNFGRHEVRNFLTASALYWLREFHLDGLRVDAVASMLYLDYSREPGQWMPNRHGGRENLEAIDFIRHLNETVHSQVPGALMIAEESTAWGGVSRPPSTGGLGFDFKWNMGWMHDTLSYFRRDPIHRRHHHGEATFSMIYAFSEDFILPLSHDEVVHGKGSLLDKMPGDRWQKFANLRLLYAWMSAHPGKKLLFMGGEIGQWREWAEDRSLDWEVLFGEEHKGLQHLVRDLNRLIRECPALHAADHDGSGFAWLEADASETSTFAFRRRAPGVKGAKDVVVALNATPVPRHDWRIGVPHGGPWRELLNTDASVYGGSNVGNAGKVQAEPVPWNGQPFSVRCVLPPLAALYFAP